MSWSINGNSIPAPDMNTYKIERNDIDSSQTGRLDNGYMFRERIRTGVYKISCTWHLTGSQKNNLENLLLSSANISFTFLDGNSFTTKTMYCSKTSSDCITSLNEGFWLFSANCEEV